MPKYERRTLKYGDIQGNEDFKEFFGMSKEEYYNQYKDIWEKYFVGGKFNGSQWHNYAFKKYIPHLTPNNEEELLRVYGSKEMSMPLCIWLVNNTFTNLAVEFDNWMDLKKGNTIWRNLNYWDNAQGLKVMDFGCGSGAYGMSMWMNGVDISLSDVASPYGEYIKWLIKKYKLEEIEWIDSSMNTDFGIEKFDYIIASECLEHVFEPMVYLEKLYKALKIAGVIYLGPSFGADYGEHEGYLGDHLHLKRNYERYDGKPWFRAVENVGLRLAKEVAEKLSYDSEMVRQVFEHKKIYIKDKKI